MSEKTNTVAALPVQHRIPTATMDVFADPASFEHAQRVAKVFASSKLIPQHLQGNIADCLIALQIARRLNEEPLTVMQQIYIVNGRPGWYTSYMISRVNRSGIFKGPITWDEAGTGDGLTVTAKAILSETGEEIRVAADMRMAAAEGWTKNAKYKSMPTHMLRWRSAAMLIRLYAPEVMLGMPVVEELETLPPMRDVTPHGAPAPSLKDALDQFATNGNGNTSGNGHAAQHDPDTGEVTDQASTQAPPAAHGEPSPPASGQPAPESSPSQPTGQMGAGAAPEPKTALEYVATRRAWIENLLDANAGEATWEAEKELRSALKVSTEARTALHQSLKAKVASLRGTTKG